MKLRERFVLGICVIFVCWTLFLVVDLQFDTGFSGHHLITPTKYQSILHQWNLRKYYTFLNNTNFDAFDDLQLLLVKKYDDDESGNENENDIKSQIVSNKLPRKNAIHRAVVISIHHDQEDYNTLDQITEITGNTSMTEFHKRISKLEMYKENDPLIDEILKEMQTQPIVRAVQKEGGTQLKLIIDYESGDQALFKPMRFPREQQTLLNHFYFTDYERHNAEIAAFHLDRLMGFRRSVPVTGRKINMTTELHDVTDEALLRTYFISPAGNHCFHGKCSYYCDTSHAICGNPDVLEASFAAFLPSKEVVNRKVTRHPWRRSYHKTRKATWELDESYCEDIRNTSPYNKGMILLNLIDTCIFDFLIGNMDRHHFETFVPFGNDSFPIHLDQGRAFGKAYHDELSILAPLTQCCLIKQSTLAMLLRFHNGPKPLSEQMRESTSKDPLNPILWEPHFVALDRRIKIILEEIRKCVIKSTTFKLPTDIGSDQNLKNKDKKYIKYSAT